jgi:hypothetical protein
MQFAILEDMVDAFGFEVWGACFRRGYGDVVLDDGAGFKPKEYSGLKRVRVRPRMSRVILA